MYSLRWLYPSRIGFPGRWLVEFRSWQGARTSNIRYIARSCNTAMGEKMRTRCRGNLFVTGIFALTTLLISGCGSWFGGSTVNPPADLPVLDKARLLDPEILWTRDIGSGSDDQFLQLRPWIDADRVYVANHSGEVQALDAANGQAVWSVDTDLRISGGPGVGAGLVLLGSSDAELLALDQSSGEERWRIRVSSEVLSVPIAAIDTVVVHTNDGKLLGLDVATGAERWRYEREVPVLTLRGSSSPVIDGGMVYCGLAGGKLLALDLSSGDPVWETAVTVPSGRSELERLADIDGDPVLYGATVYVATYQGAVAAIAGLSGNTLWTRELSSYSGLAADWRQVYASDDQGHVWALDGDTGAARWRQESLYNRKLSSPAVIGDYVVVGDFDGYLHWMSVDDGNFIARTRVGSRPITTGPRVVNDVMYVLGDGGDLAAMRAPTADQP